MKKTLVLIFIVLTLFISCSEKKENLYYYGYFQNEAVLVAYSSAKNTVYDIHLPLDVIVSWGLDNGIENIPNAIRSFAGYPDSAFMFGSEDTFEAAVQINRVVKSSLQSMKNQTLISNLNKLCGADFSALAERVCKDNPEFKSLDTRKFTEYTNPEKSRLYLTNWLKQVIGE